MTAALWNKKRYAEGGAQALCTQQYHKTCSTRPSPFCSFELFAAVFVVASSSWGMSSVIVISCQRSLDSADIGTKKELCQSSATVFHSWPAACQYLLGLEFATQCKKGGREEKLQETSSRSRTKALPFGQIAVWRKSHHKAWHHASMGLISSN